MSNNIGEKIRSRRMALGLSQTELARRAGYADKSGISKIESGERDLTSEKIAIFAQALDMDPAELLPDIWSRPLGNDQLILTEEEQSIIWRLRMLDEGDRQKVLQVLAVCVSAFERGIIEEGSDNAGL